jgi:hypothetical protein
MLYTYNVEQDEVKFMLQLEHEWLRRIKSNFLIQSAQK